MWRFIKHLFIKLEYNLKLWIGYHDPIRQVGDASFSESAFSERLSELASAGAISQQEVCASIQRVGNQLLNNGEFSKFYSLMVTKLAPTYSAVIAQHFPVPNAISHTSSQIDWCKWVLLSPQLDWKLIAQLTRDGHKAVFAPFLRLRRIAINSIHTEMETHIKVMKAIATPSNALIPSKGSSLRPIYVAFQEQFLAHPAYRIELWKVIRYSDAVSIKDLLDHSNLDQFFAQLLPIQKKEMFRGDPEFCVKYLSDTNIDQFLALFSYNSERMDVILRVLNHKTPRAVIQKHLKLLCDHLNRDSNKYKSIVKVSAPFWTKEELRRFLISVVNKWELRDFSVAMLSALPPAKCSEYAELFAEVFVASKSKELLDCLLPYLTPAILNHVFQNYQDEYHRIYESSTANKKFFACTLLDSYSKLQPDTQKELVRCCENLCSPKHAFADGFHKLFSKSIPYFSKQFIEAFCDEIIATKIYGHLHCMMEYKKLSRANGTFDAFMQKLDVLFRIEDCVRVMPTAMYNEWARYKINKGDYSIFIHSSAVAIDEGTIVFAINHADTKVKYGYIALLCIDLHAKDPQKLYRIFHDEKLTNRLLDLYQDNIDLLSIFFRIVCDFQMEACYPKCANLMNAKLIYDAEIPSFESMTEITNVISFNWELFNLLGKSSFFKYLEENRYYDLVLKFHEQTDLQFVLDYSGGYCAELLSHNNFQLPFLMLQHILKFSAAALRNDLSEHLQEAILPVDMKDIKRAVIVGQLNQHLSYKVLLLKLPEAIDTLVSHRKWDALRRIRSNFSNGCFQVRIDPLDSLDTDNFISLKNNVIQSLGKFGSFAFFCGKKEAHDIFATFKSIHSLKLVSKNFFNLDVDVVINAMVPVLCRPKSKHLCFEVLQSLPFADSIKKVTHSAQATADYLRSGCFGVHSKIYMRLLGCKFSRLMKDKVDVEIVCAYLPLLTEETREKCISYIKRKFKIEVPENDYQNLPKLICATSSRFS